MNHGDCRRYNFSSRDAAVAQSVERRIGSAEVTGPIPVSSSLEKRGNLVFTGFPLFLLFKTLNTP